MKSCFVSMPLGVRERPHTGQHIDFDVVFAKLIEPAAAAAEVTLLRWQTVLSTGGPFTQRDALRAIIASDVLLADVSTLNPNVMYELGIRHAANRGPTVIVAVEGERLPFYVSYIPAFFYDAQNPEGARTQLENALRIAARRSDGSPVYEFFPELHVELPPELSSEERRARRSGAGRDRSVPPPRRRDVLRVGADPRTVELVEAAVRGAAEVDPATFIDMLKSYRDAGDWDGVIRAGQSPPPALERDPRVTQLVALAFTQRGRKGDEEQALGMMQGLLDESGGDAEAFGIVGRIYKNRYKQSHDEEDLRRAIKYYCEGFELQPNDFYAGYNAVTLTSLLPEGDAMRQSLGELLPKVKRVLEQRLDGGEMSYSLTTAAIELAVIERNWDQARTLAAQADALAPSDWQRAASIESLQRLGGGLTPPERQRHSEVIVALRGAEQDSDEEDEPDA